MWKDFRMWRKREYKIRFSSELWIWAVSDAVQQGCNVFSSIFCRLMAGNEKHNISISFPNENYAWITTRMWIVKENALGFSFFVFQLWLWSSGLWCADGFSDTVGIPLFKAFLWNSNFFSFYMSYSKTSHNFTQSWFHFAYGNCFPHNLKRFNLKGKKEVSLLFITSYKWL